MTVCAVLRQASTRAGRESFQALHRCYNHLTTYVSRHIVKGGQSMKIEVKKVEKILATVMPLPKSDS